MIYIFFILYPSYLIFTNFLFSDAKGNTIHIQYLPLLEDINKICRYSWSATTLAHLYINLSRCAKKMHNFAGCGVLLQAWGGPECQDFNQGISIHSNFHMQPSMFKT